MVTKKTFFLASAGELIRERDLTEITIHRKNSSLIDRDLFFEVIRWEELLQTFEKSRVQERFLSWVSDCDVLIVIFHTKVGKFTKEELDLAFHNLRSGQNPRHILVYFKDSKRTISKIDKGILEIINMKKEIQNNQQYFIEFHNLAELELSLLKQLELLTNVFEREIGRLIPPESQIISEAAKMPLDTAIAKQIPDVREIRELAKSIGLFRNWHVNPHLTFDEGDIKFFWERHRSRSWLETQLRARYLILQRADELELLIPEPGDLSEKAKHVEARLLTLWQSAIAKHIETNKTQSNAVDS